MSARSSRLSSVLGHLPGEAARENGAAPLSARDRFSGVADLYARFRPSYPAQLVDWLLGITRLAPGAAIADVGCGTGISTRLFAERGFHVVGLDPNPAMLGEARRLAGGRCRRGEASATGLADHSIDLITVAQAFHWFDVSDALTEFERVLVAGGWCAALWNLRASSPFLADYDRLLRALSSEYSVLQKPLPTLQAIRRHARVRHVHQDAFEHVQELDREGLFGRAYSSSYVVHGVRDRAAFDRALEALFLRHERGGCVEFAYRSLGMCWRLGE